MNEATRRYLVTLRAAGILDANGNPIEKVGMFAFGAEPSPDVDDGKH